MIIGEHNRDDLVQGQLKGEAEYSGDSARQFYKLGRVSAALDSQRKQLEEERMKNMLQQVEMVRQRMMNEEVLNNINMKVSQLSMLAQGQGMGMPMGMPPGAMPPGQPFPPPMNMAQGGGPPQMPMANVPPPMPERGVPPPIFG